MTYKQYHRLKNFATECRTLEDYITGCGGVAPVQVLTDIWTVVRNPTFATLQDLSGMGNKEFAEEYGVKLRTLENWRSNTNILAGTYFDLLCADVIAEKNKI